MKYAVISLKNNQYMISEGEEIYVDRIEEGDIDPQVLFLVDEEKAHIGKPVLKKAKIDLEYLGEERGKKLHVRTYKAKSRSRRKLGFRPVYTKLHVKSISPGS